MSWTEDNDFEFFPTEREVVYALMEANLFVDLPGGTWIEPCAGTGRIISAVNEHRSDVHWLINEIDPRFNSFLRDVTRGWLGDDGEPMDGLLPYGDFVHRDWPFEKAEVLIMNPPFTLTQQFVIAAGYRAETVVCLQRQGWFGTQERAAWLQAHCPDVYQLPWRPSFRPDGKTDNCEYCWYIWPPGSLTGERRTGRISMLEKPASRQQTLFWANPGHHYTTEKTKMAKKKQGVIPGTQNDEIEELTEASEAYQHTIRERLAVQSTEADQKAHLESVVGRLIKEGKLKLNPQIPDGIKQPVYAYTDDQGNKRTVHAQREKLKISVKVEKSKDE